MEATPEQESATVTKPFHWDDDRPSSSVVPGVYFRWKSPLMRLFAAFLLVIALPIIAVLAVLIRITSRGPSIFRQVRAGKHGKPFLMYKLRIMTLNAESDSGAAWSSDEDPRLTRLGKWMRSHHLDELPQLFNVVLGQMDLFGPRPERPEFIRVLRRSIPNYERRMDVLPGITGLSQIMLPPDVDLDSVRRKLQLDLEYLHRASLWLELRIFVCTFLRLIGIDVQLAMRVSGLLKTTGATLSRSVESPAHAVHVPTSLDELRASDSCSSPQFDAGQLPVATMIRKDVERSVLTRERRHDLDPDHDEGEGKRAPNYPANDANGPVTRQNAQLTHRENTLSELPEGTEVLNALTIDVEDYFQVTGFEESITRESWGSFESRVVQNTRQLLRILDHHEVKATFFVLGWTADRYPEIVKEIHEQGHEIGSHSYWHRLIYELSPSQFRDDLRRSREILEGIVDQRITTFRAPSFSIIEKSAWALDILVEEGFTIDSSVFPVHHHRYGMPNAPVHIHQLNRNAGAIWEFPPSTLQMCGTNVPVAGGGYFRLYPAELTFQAIRRVNRTGDPFLFYLHPWELDSRQPRIVAGTPLSRYRHYLNLEAVEDRLNLLLEMFRFGRLSDSLATRLSTFSCRPSCEGRAANPHDVPPNRPR